jgi:hypothetical protein
MVDLFEFNQVANAAADLLHARENDSVIQTYYEPESYHPQNFISKQVNGTKENRNGYMFEYFAGATQG